MSDNITDIKSTLAGETEGSSVSKSSDGDGDL